MKKLIIPFAVLVSILICLQSCSKSPIEKAIALIEATKDDYINPPKFTFDSELREVIDRNANDVIGYTLGYTVEFDDGTKFIRRAKFNKDITVKTDDSVLQVIE